MMKMMMMKTNFSYKMWGTLVFLFFGYTLIYLNGVRGHGRLIEPPSRSSMWRYGFNTTANYNDHELYCGGFSRQYQTNGGNCGVCGDAFDMTQPRPNEAGGVYGQGIIVRKYSLNSIIRIKIELTANHRGYFEFRLCPNNNPKKVVSQKCLDNYILKQSNGEGERYFPGEGSKVFESRYLLPKSLTCTQCVIQWRYVAGNNWGPCPNGTQGVGCGPQEEFRACADVAITDRSGHASAEEDDTENNDVDTNKLEGDNVTTTTTTSEKPEDEQVKDPVVWPFIMALLALVVAALGFGALFGWFYRKEVIQFARDTVSHSNSWKMTLGNNNGSSSGGSNHLTNGQTHTSSPTSLSPQQQYHNNANNRPPIPPPRNKKSTNLNEEYHNQQNQIRHGPITPDVISHPMQVTINGLTI